MKKILEKVLIGRIFRKHRNTLPAESDNSNKKMEQHTFADAVFCNDELMNNETKDAE